MLHIKLNQKNERALTERKYFPP